MPQQNELKEEFKKLMHEIIKRSKAIMEQGDYSDLLKLCEQDITILDCVEGKENLTAKEISRLLGVPKTTIVTAVSRLAARGYICRAENENDRRERFLRLTEKGIMANAEHIRYERLILEELTNMWKAEDQPVLAELLRRRA